MFEPDLDRFSRPLWGERQERRPTLEELTALKIGRRESVQGMTLMPPAAEVCQCCAVDHKPEQPHNQDSLYWKYWFYGQNGRWPNWSDAMAHCSPEIQQAWKDALKEHGVEVDQ